MAAARRASTPATLVRYSIVPRLSSIGLHAALRRAVQRRERGVVELVPDQRVGRFRHQQRGRRDGAEHDPRVGADAARVERDVDAGADDRDVHLGARDEAQIGVARSAPARFGRRNSTMNSSVPSEVRPGPVAMLSTGTSRRPFGPDDTQSRPRRSAPARCRRPARHCTDCRRAMRGPGPGSSRSGSRASTTPGQACASASCSPITAPEVAAPMTKPPPSSRMPIMPGIFLVSTISRGLHPAGSQLNQQVGPTGQDFGEAGGSGERRERRPRRMMGRYNRAQAWRLPER